MEPVCRSRAASTEGSCRKTQGYLAKEVARLQADAKYVRASSHLQYISLEREHCISTAYLMIAARKAVITFQSYKILSHRNLNRCAVFRRLIRPQTQRPVTQTSLGSDFMLHLLLKQHSPNIAALFLIFLLQGCFWSNWLLTLQFLHRLDKQYKTC